MTAAVLLGHVRAYADAVRSNLADLTPEQVDDLTDGLEADLADALEDPEGAAATGEIPIGRVIDPLDDGDDSVIDLSRHFGPAAAYAAELRTAAGLEGVPTRVGRRRASDLAVQSWAGGRGWLEQSTRAFRSSPFGTSAIGFAAALRPVWWLVRGWVLYTLVVGLTHVVGPAERFVPRLGLSWLLLAVLVVASIQVGRGVGGRWAWSRGLVVGASVLAAGLLIPSLFWFQHAVQQRLDARSVQTVFVQTTQPAAKPENGVFVDGMQVSNLFVYDSAGNPLTGVQVFDDRGRAVRTTYDGGAQGWSLPGVEQAWTFLPSQDEDGRNRWNVYPLSGLPSDQVQFDDASKLPRPDAGTTPRTPPRPFAKAPAIVPSTAVPAPPVSSTSESTPGSTAAATS